MRVVNWNLMRHPMNWVTIWLMLFIAGIALHLILQGLGIRPQAAQPAGYGTTPPNSSATGATG